MRLFHYVVGPPTRVKWWKCWRLCWRHLLLVRCGAVLYERMLHLAENEGNVDSGEQTRDTDSCIFWYWSMTFSL